MVSQRLRVGISTCPNDTFAFHALLTGEVDARGLAFEWEFLDVQALNERALAGSLDVAKVSFHAALRMAERMTVLSAGSALGFGVGPLVLAPGTDAEHGDDPARVLCPGEWTTATLLWRLFHPGEGALEQVVFSAIMPALEAGEAELGVCIHEGRFTWRERGLRRVEDLGETWERATGSPLPLGGIVARRDLGAETIARFDGALADSIRWARAHPDACLTTMRLHAQELDDDVIRAHVDLYVNDWTVELGDVGRGALEQLAERAEAAGLVPAGTRLTVG